jgi:hypothetical protein
MPRTIKEEIIQQVDRLDPPHQRKVLEFVRGLGVPRGTPGRELLKFAGAIDQRDLEAISEAIQEGCEKVEPNGW